MWRSLNWGLCFTSVTRHQFKKKKKNEAKKKKLGWYLCKIFNIAHMAWNECVGSPADKRPNLRSYLTAERVCLIEMRKKKEKEKKPCANLPRYGSRPPHRDLSVSFLSHSSSVTVADAQMQEKLKEKQQTLYRAWLQPACQGWPLILSLCTQSSFGIPVKHNCVVERAAAA